MTYGEARSLLHNLEKLRRKARLSQIDTADLAKITRRSYISWMQGKGPLESRVPELQFAILVIEQGLKEGLLPIEGHDRRSVTADKRRKVIRDLVRRYPINPYRAAQS